MTNKQKNNIVFIIESIIRLVSLGAVLCLFLSVIAMVEVMSITAEMTTVFFACLAWLASVVAYKCFVDR